MQIIGPLILAFLLNTAWAADEHGGSHEGGDEADQSSQSSEYIQISPPLVVNLQGRHHYLRAEVQMLVDGQENIDHIKMHLPALRHTLIMLFGDRDPATLATVEEREKLRASAKEEIVKFLDEYSSSEGMQDVYFTSFLVQ